MFCRTELSRKFVRTCLGSEEIISNGRWVSACRGWDCIIVHHDQVGFRLFQLATGWAKSSIWPHSLHATFNRNVNSYAYSRQEYVHYFCMNIPTDYFSNASKTDKKSISGLKQRVSLYLTSFTRHGLDRYVSSRWCFDQVIPWICSWILCYRHVDDETLIKEIRQERFVTNLDHWVL